VVLTVLTTAAGPLLWWLGSAGLTPNAVAGLTAVEFLVASACAGAGALLAVWWFVALVGTAMAALGHRWRSVRLVRWGQAVSPQFLRRVAASTLGINLLLAPGAWAGTEEPGGVTAAPAHHATVVHQQAPGPAATLPQPGWLATSREAPSGASSASGELPTPTWRPSKPTPPVPGSGHPGRTHGATPKSVTVRAGDCLWDLAAEELGPYATDLEIDRRWRQWHRLNQPVIGADADALVPGTILQAPPVS
jgi:nucleoid-associated protein YgaU